MATRTNEVGEIYEAGTQQKKSDVDLQLELILRLQADKTFPKALIQS